jgi:hypothetical protein
MPYPIAFAQNSGRKMQKHFRLCGKKIVYSARNRLTSAYFNDNIVQNNIFLGRKGCGGERI